MREPSLWSIRYIEEVMALARTAAAAEQPNIVEAALLIADAIEQGKRWWVFGTGHSHLLVEEVWGRAGGLTSVYPILEPALMLHEGLEKSSRLERRSGLAADLIEVHGPEQGDCLLIISNSGRNAVPVQMAEEALRRGIHVLALTSLLHSKSISSRAPSGKRLFELAEVTIDNHGVPGDAILRDDRGDVGATSTVIGGMLIQALAVEIVGILRARGLAAPTYSSNNS